MIIIIIYVNRIKREAKNIKLLLTLILACVSAVSLADNHDENNLVMLSMFTNPVGQKMSVLEKMLLNASADNEKRGYNRCGVYKHRRIGSSRSALTFCYFNDFAQYAKIEDARDAEVGNDAAQFFADHTDHMISILEKNLKPNPKYLLFARMTFGPYLTGIERDERARGQFEYYEDSFGGCNLATHMWGPELAHYIACGFESHKEFAEGLEIFSKNNIAEVKADILEHSDDLYIRVDN